MASISEVGAASVDVKSYKCSIKKISVSTKWKAPDEEVDEMVSTTVYDNEEEEGKTIYLISSPKGKKVTIKTEREDGQCQRESHKKYKMVWDDYKNENADKDNANDEDNKKDTADSSGSNGNGMSGGGHGGGGGGGIGLTQTDATYSTRIKSKFNSEGLALAVAKDAALSFPFSPILLPFNLIKTPIIIQEEIKNEDTFTIKCFEIGGAWEALKYWRLPIPLDKKYVTQFSHLSCKEGPIQYQIISYPDISFKFEITVGSKEKKDKDADSKLELESKTLEEVPSQLKELAFNAVETGFSFCLPKFTATTTFNGKKSKLELEFDSNAIKQMADRKKEKKEKKQVEILELKDVKELLHFKYEHNGYVFEFGSAVLQAIPSTINKVVAFVDLFTNICNLEFIRKLIDFDKAELVKNFKPYKLNFEPPGLSFSVEGKYHTSRDLTKIGRYYVFNVSADPLVCVSLTVDLLFLLISALSAGTATGFYVLLKNLDSVIKMLLGDDYKDDYKGNAPFSADVYIDLVVTGQINSSFQYISDSIKEDKNKRNYSITPIDGSLKVDLKAGIKASIQFFYLLNASGELSASASSGINLTIGFEDHLKEGKGIVLPYETVFNGLKIKYCVKGCVGLKKVFSFGKAKKGEKTVIDKMKIEMFTGEFVLFGEKSGNKDESGSNGKGGAGHGGGGGGVGGW